MAHECLRNKITEDNWPSDQCYYYLDCTMCISHCYYDNRSKYEVDPVLQLKESDPLQEPVALVSVH